MISKDQKRKGGLHSRASISNKGWDGQQQLCAWPYTEPSVEADYTLSIILHGISISWVILRSFILILNIYIDDFCNYQEIYQPDALKQGRMEPVVTIRAGVVPTVQFSVSLIACLKRHLSIAWRIG